MRLFVPTTKSSTFLVGAMDVYSSMKADHSKCSSSQDLIPKVQALVYTRNLLKRISLCNTVPHWLRGSTKTSSVHQDVEGLRLRFKFSEAVEVPNMTGMLRIIECCLWIVRFCGVKDSLRRSIVEGSLPPMAAAQSRMVESPLCIDKTGGIFHASAEGSRSLTTCL